MQLSFFFFFCSPIKYAQTGNYFSFVFGGKYVPDFRNYKPQWRQCLIFVQTLSQYSWSSRMHSSPFPQPSAINGCSRYLGSCSSFTELVYLESCCRLRTGKNQRWNENHAREVAWPLCSCQDGDGTSLQCKMGRVAVCQLLPAHGFLTRPMDEVLLSCGPGREPRGGPPWKRHHWMLDKLSLQLFYYTFFSESKHFREI